MLWNHTRKAATTAIFILLLQLGCTVAMSGDAVAEETGLNSGAAAPIQISADRLETNSTENYAEFIGDVEAVQGSFSMRADTLRIYYRRGKDLSELGDARQESIIRIVAGGNVIIESVDQRAEAEHAEYSVEDGIIALTGPSAMVTDGKNSIRGKKITLNRATGQISVAGGQDSRVQAVFFSDRNLAPSGLMKQEKKE